MQSSVEIGAFETSAEAFLFFALKNPRDFAVFRAQLWYVSIAVASAVTMGCICILDISVAWVIMNRVKQTVWAYGSYYFFRVIQSAKLRFGHFLGQKKITLFQKNILCAHP